MPKVKVVLDTNLVISSLWPGTPRRLVNLCKTGQITVLVSEPIIKEYLEVLGRFSITTEDAHEFIVLFTEPFRTMVVIPREKINVVKTDPSDDKFLECALTGNADVIISGDRHLKELKVFKGIPILSASDFLKQYKF